MGSHKLHVPTARYPYGNWRKKLEKKKIKIEYILEPSEKYILVF
jgi:hypothetical protein